MAILREVISESQEAITQLSARLDVIEKDINDHDRAVVIIAKATRSINKRLDTLEANQMELMDNELEFYKKITAILKNIDGV